MGWPTEPSKWLLFASCWFASTFAADPYEYSECVRPSDTQNADKFFQFKVYGLAYDVFDFKDYEGRIFFAVNVASFWGYTPQYRKMNDLQEKYGPEYAKANHPSKPHCHVQFFGFPCNQFGYQEPAENFELMNCLKYVRPGYGFVPSFPLAGKLKVNGKDEDPIFTFLKGRCAAPMGLIANRTDITWTPIRNNDISWNFAKWLVGSDGHPYRRYTSRTKPQQVEQDILDLINKCVNDESTHGGSVGNATVAAPLLQQIPQQQQQQAVPLNQPAVVQTPDAPKSKRSADHHALFF